MSDIGSYKGDWWHGSRWAGAGGGAQRVGRKTDVLSF